MTPAAFADGTPIPHGQLAKFLCDGEFHRVIFGSEGEILDSGRTQRLFTPGQTRAVIARDRHCQYPGCSAPPWQGEIHHSIWWYHKGTTSTTNAILLCWYHHTYVHQHHLTITRRPIQDGEQPAEAGQARHGEHARPGEWVFTQPDGHQICPPPPPSTGAPPDPGRPPSTSAPPPTSDSLDLPESPPPEETLSRSTVPARSQDSISCCGHVGTSSCPQPISDSGTYLERQARLESELRGRSDSPIHARIRQMAPLMSRIQVVDRSPATANELLAAVQRSS